MSDEWFKRLEEDGLLVNCISSLGWSFWPFKADGTTTGYFDEHSLRKLADEIERRNKPFWDEYNAYCESLALLPQDGLDSDLDIDIAFPGLTGVVAEAECVAEGSGQADNRNETGDQLAETAK